MLLCLLAGGTGALGDTAVGFVPVQDDNALVAGAVKSRRLPCGTSPVRGSMVASGVARQ